MGILLLYSEAVTSTPWAAKCGGGADIVIFLCDIRDAGDTFFHLTARQSRLTGPSNMSSPGIEALL